MVKVKICGITSRADAKAAVDCGADALGFICARESPRFIAYEEIRKIIRTLPPFVTTVGVFTEGTESALLEAVSICGIDMIQFHGHFQPNVIEPFYTRAIQVVPVQNEGDITCINPLPVRAYLVDIPREANAIRTPFDWKIVLPVKRWGDLILAGALTPENVHAAVETVQPYAVDVCSGVEKEKGKKDYAKMKRFIKAAKGRGGGKAGYAVTAG